MYEDYGFAFTLETIVGRTPLFGVYCITDREVIWNILRILPQPRKNKATRKGRAIVVEPTNGETDGRWLAKFVFNKKQVAKKVESFLRKFNKIEVENY